MDIATLVRRCGGMAQKRQLVALGARDHHLTAAVRSGEVIRARQGWYTVLAATDPRVRAVRVGGRLTGRSAIAALGGWVRDTGPLQVAVAANAARLRSQTDRRVHPPAPRIAGVRLHWSGSPALGMVVPLEEALERMLRDDPREDAVAALDWALHTGRLDRLDVEGIMLRLPPARRIPWSDLDPACESLPESLARTRLRSAGHSVVTQRRLDGLERVDLVVDGLLALETDGEEFHAGRFLADRDKDRRILDAGLIPFRVPAVRVFRDWPDVHATIRTTLANFGNSGNPPRKARRKRLRGTQPARVPEFPRAGEGIGGARPAFAPV